MNRDSVSWQGFWVATPTPFKENGDLDLDAFRWILNNYIEDGVHGLVINGTTGEWFSQTKEERMLVAEAAVDVVKKRVPVIIGCTDYTANKVAEFAKHARSIGADGILVSAPPYSKPNDNEVYTYYEDIASMVDIPIIVYNWPHGCSLEIGPELAERLTQIDNVVAIKDSSPNTSQIYETAKRVVDKVRVFGPYMTVEGFEKLKELHTDGYIAGGSIFGKDDPKYWESFWAKDYEFCLRHARRLEDAFAKLWLPGGWRGYYGSYQAQIKAIMNLIGQPGGYPRKPFLPITDKNSLEALRKILEEAGVQTVKATLS